MPVIRTTPTENYTPIRNNADLGMNSKEFHLWYVMVTLPADWSFSKSWLMKRTGMGRDAMDKTLKGLMDKRLVTMQRIRNEDGTLNGVDYTVYDQPYTHLTENQCIGDSNHITENQSTGHQNPEKQHLQKNKETKELEIQNTQVDSVESTSEVDDAFEFWWENSGMYKQNKQRAREAWSKAVCTRDPFTFAHELIADCQKRLTFKQRGFDEMHPTTYLTGNRWTDEIRDNRAAFDILNDPEIDQLARPIDHREQRRRNTAVLMDLKDTSW